MILSEEILDKYEMTIGIECHVQLKTKTKLFSSADNDARDKEPNSVVSPIDYALPGMLPVLNEEAVKLAVKVGLALNSDINKVSRFDRKHYFYPDLPKGYQISQMYQPIIGAGYVDVVDFTTGESTRVRIEHAHLEEDAGKLTHESGGSLVDLNRCGTPLVEIVSMPDIHSAGIAKAYAMELHRLMTFADVTEGDLYQGNMRFDVNISVALKGAKELGKRAEVKNLNSFKSVERAAEYEFRRQVELLESGEKVVQETRGWNDAKGKTTSQRSKEEAQDYRYMPEPDVPPVVLSDECVDEIKKGMPKMPGEYRSEWSGLGLDSSVVETVLNDRKMAERVTEVLGRSTEKAAARTAHWFTGALGEIDEESEFDVARIDAARIIELSDMVEKNELSSTAAKQVFLKMVEGDDSPREIAGKANLIQVSDEGELEKIVDEVLGLPECEQAVNDVRSGEMKAIGFLVGQVMKRSGGKANPGIANKIIQGKLK